MAENKRIVITGMGPVTSVGIGSQKLWQGILEKKNGLELVKENIDGELWDSYFVHKIKDFNIQNFCLNQDILDYIEDWKEDSIDIDLQYLLAATKLALDDSQINYDSEKNKMGMIVSHENPGMEKFVHKFLNESFNQHSKKYPLTKKKFFNEIYYKVVKDGYETQSFMTLFHLAKVFKIHEYSLFVNNACASGLYAIEAGSDTIKLGKTPITIVVAGDHSNIFKHLWFKMIEMYEEDGKIKPFSRAGKGLVMGEGAVALILEDYEHALKRGAKIYAEYLGGGFKLEGWQITRPQIGGASYYEAINAALANSRISKDEIDMLCLHGFGTLAGDYYEAKAIMDIFGDKTPATAFKPYVGHNLGGSSLIETSILLLALKNNIIPPILNTQEIDPRINLDLVLSKERNCNLRHVMKTCAAFAGYNAACVFKKIG